MRNRLIRKFTRAKEGSLGYTMTEVLVVVGIIAIACAIAIPSVFWFSRTLRFKQANDYAKSIFLAAQQNLSEMRADGALPSLQSTGGTLIPAEMDTFPAEFRTEYVYTTTGEAAFEMIVPTGSVEEDARSGSVIIEYNPLTGNVYAVFYCEEDIQEAYRNGELPRDHDARKELLLGYYDGSGLNSSQIQLEKTQAEVQFINGEEGIVSVRVPMPDSFYGDYGSFAKAMHISLIVSGEQTMLKNMTGAVEGNRDGSVIIMEIKRDDLSNCRLDVDGKTVVVDYAIDSLMDGQSFANHASQNYNALTAIADENEFHVLPGENITIQADVSFSGLDATIQVDSGLISGVNPMFEALAPTGTEGKYTLHVSNGRNLQNLNAIAPEIAKQITNVVFTSDIYWNDTVSYYNSKSASGSYRNGAAEAPARALPYFVPIHHEDLFGTARFIFPGENDGGLGDLIEAGLKKLNEMFGGYNSENTPTLTDEMDKVMGATHASIQGGGYGVYNLVIDSTAYTVPNVGSPTGTVEGKFYATGPNQIVDYSFTGLFGYVNTPIDSLRVVNPIIKGRALAKESQWVYEYAEILGVPIPGGVPVKKTFYNNPTTGGLVGTAGYDALITNCGVYVDRDARGFNAGYIGQDYYQKDAAQKWYGVSGEGAVGGLVGYAKSHLAVKGQLSNDIKSLAFSRCFAAVPVSGNMRTTTDKHFGYSNGVGGFIGNSQLTNFYNCYSSGRVLAQNCVVKSTRTNEYGKGEDWYGVDLELIQDGRTCWGAGGFVGTSHGTRYSNCFSTGDVKATSNKNMGAGGFVGFMNLDETYDYGNDTSSDIAQRTVFTNCYSVGTAITDGTTYENFSGANGRMSFAEKDNYITGDYYRLYAPYYKKTGNVLPNNSKYIFKDTYFLRDYNTGKKVVDNSSVCAQAQPYGTFEKLHVGNASWVDSQVNEVKTILLDIKYSWSWGGLKEERLTYETEYFKGTDLEKRYTDLYTASFPNNEWEAASAETTHPYGISSGGVVYPFSKLKGMDYYGDWPGQPSAVGMAYYETYLDEDGKEVTHYLFDKERDDEEHSNLKLRNDLPIVDDGYVIFSANNANMTVNVGGVTETLSHGMHYTINDNPYYVFELKANQLQVQPDKGEYYVTVEVKQEGETYRMYFNPHMALSHANPAGGANTAAKPAIPKTIYIRSAGQFAAISKLDPKCWAEGTQFIQQLDVDATIYKWPGETVNNFAVHKADPIGNENNPFNATYMTAGGYVEQAKIIGFRPGDSGLFGCIGTSGKVENILIQTENSFTVTADSASAGILVGVNKGTVNNVDLVLGNEKDGTGKAAITAKTNAGLLAGVSSGTISNCEVTAYSGAELSAVNAGGLVGKTEGTEARKSELTKNTLKIKGELKLTGTNAGGIVGCAEQTTGKNLEITLGSEMKADADSVGGLAGKTGSDSGKDGDTSFTTAAIELKGINGGVRGYVAGAVGNAKNTKLVDINMKSSGTISGNVAAGFLGYGENADANNSKVELASGGTISGKDSAGGVAGILGPQCVFERVPVSLKDATVKGANAAGYAAKIEGEATVQNGAVTLGGKARIEGTQLAAGYAVSVSGSVGSGSVRGHGTIKGDKAAGFAAEMSGRGQISNAVVSPALNADNYKGNANRNLKVEAATEAAGFALTIGDNCNVRNSTILCKLTDNKSSGFAGVNGGVIEGSTTNVDLAGGYAFVRENNGTIARCYGWYGDGVETRTETNTETSFGGTGKCYSAYFGDRNPELPADLDQEATAIVLYDANGNRETMTASKLSTEGHGKLVGSNKYSWTQHMVNGTTTYESYPYSTTIKPTYYLYPMLRDHFGDWLAAPQFAYGVAYYEFSTNENNETVKKVHIVDLSDETATKEKQSVSTQLGGSFDNSGTITRTGYAIFRKTNSDKLDGLKGEPLDIQYEVTLNDHLFKYEFFELKTDGAKDGVLQLPSDSTKNGGKVDIRFADAIDVSDNYQIRTEAQLANIAGVSASFKQTHDIVLTKDLVSADIAGDKVYNGNGLRIEVPGAVSKTWLTVGGKVENLNLTVKGAVTAPIFDKMDGTLSLGTVNLESGIDKGGALVGGGNGQVTVTSLGKLSAVNGALVGSSTGSVTIKSAIDVAGDVVTLFGDVQNVTTGTIQVGGSVTDKLFGKASGTVQTGAITTGAAKQIFGDVTGSVTTGAITVKGDVSGQVFGNASGAVSAAAITADWISGKVVRDVTGTAALGDITIGGTSTADAETIAGPSETTPPKSAVGNLFGTVSGEGSLSGSAVNLNGLDIQGSLFAGVSGGKLSGFQVKNVGKIDSPLVGGDSMGGTLSGISLNVSGVTGVKGGLLTSKVTNKVEKCSVTVANAVDVPNGTFGGITGTNSGTISGSSVNASFTVAGGTFGGITGTNSGNLTNNQVTATVSFASTMADGLTAGGLAGTSTGTKSNNEFTTGLIFATDKVVNVTFNGNDQKATTIGGLVGAMNGGKITGKSGTAIVTGAINLTSGSGKDKNVVVGGVIGKLDGGAIVSDVQSAVSVDSKWAGAKSQGGTVAATGNGPVGMFVGYVGQGSFSGCASVDQSNTTYQFLGEAEVSTKPLEGELLTTTVKYDKGIFYDSALQKFNSKEDMSGDDLTPGKPANEKATNYIKVTLENGCTYYIKDSAGAKQMTQTYKVSEYYYKKGTESQKNGYVVADAVYGSFASKSSIKFTDVLWNEGTAETKYYIQTADGYYRMTVKRENVSWFEYMYTITYGNTEQEISLGIRDITSAQILDKLKKKDVAVTGIFEITQPTVNEGNYLLVSGETAYKGDSGSAAFAQSFNDRSPLANLLYSASELPSTALDKNSYSASEVTDGKIYLTATVQGNVCKIYTVNVDSTVGYTVTKYDWTYQDADYQRQGLDAVAVGTNASTVSEVSAPAGNAGGETQENNP